MNDLLYKRDKTKEDIEQLLYENKNLVYYMLTKTGQLLNQDAESAAWEGLWDAVNLFDIYSKTAFSTFACVIMRNAINDVLRKQKHYGQHTCCFTETIENTCACFMPEEESMEFCNRIEDLFNEYLKARAGISRDILLAWRSSEYTSSATNLAIICKTSPSYVSRVQLAFRAFISGKLKGQ
jgi:DNA-directed RNA polymerase specialized sigma24 family protein